MIVWGTRIVRHREGRVADFCQLCRQPRAFVLSTVRSVGHIY